MCNLLKYLLPLALLSSLEVNKMLCVLFAAMTKDMITRTWKSKYTRENNSALT